MNTRDMLERAVDLLYEYQRVYQNRTYLSTSEQELKDSFEVFLDQLESMD